MEAKKVTDIELINAIIKVNPEFQEYNDRIIEMLTSSGALLKGHFELLSKKHSDYFLRFNNISRYPQNVKFISDMLVSKIDNINFDAVISPDTAGILLAHGIAEAMVKPRFTARTNENRMPTELINFIDLKAKTKVLIVNDMTTTTEGLKRLIALVESYNAIPVGIALFATRSGICRKEVTELKEKYPNFVSVIELDVFEHEYEKDSCPICIKSQGQDEPVKSWKLN